MSAPRCSDEEFIALFREGGGAHTARALNLDVRNVYARRRNIEKKFGISLTSPTSKAVEHKAQVPLRVRDGTVIVGSDAHLWPGKETTAQRAFRTFIRDMQPAAVILNGDVFDGAGISRFPSIGFLEKKPSVAEEIAGCKKWLDSLVDVAGKAKRFWTLGNHDLRFEAFLASRAAEMEGVGGMHLKDHFPAWTPCWSVSINSDVWVTHRWKGGVHATHNNAVNSGKSMVTGHLHSAKVTPFSDLNGTRYGVDCGTLAEPYDEQFVHYTEASPVNWRSGFCVLTFRNSRLLCPELVMKWDEDSVEFRGKVVTV